MNLLIKTRRKELGITLEEIGDYVGVSKTTVQRWESGNISSMRSDRIKKLSEILQIDAEELIGVHSDSGSVEKIPVFDRIVPGVPIAAQEDILGFVEVSAARVQNGTMFALKIKGDSMEPRIADGDTVLVRCQKTVENGETAVVAVDGQAVCRKVLKHSDGIVLVANNPTYPPALYTAKDVQEKRITVLGRVVELRAEF